MRRQGHQTFAAPAAVKKTDGALTIKGAPKTGAPFIIYTMTWEYTRCVSAR